jgi:hypothetical protein
MAKRHTYSGPVFTIRLSKGLADTHRLPVDQVVRFLTETKAMLEDAARRIGIDSGLEDSTDLGIQVIAGFQRGSFKTSYAMTRNYSIAAAAAREVLRTVSGLRDSAGPNRKRKTKVVRFEPRVVARLNNIAKVQEITRTEMDLSLRYEGKTTRAVFDDLAVGGAAAFKTAHLRVGGVNLYGKLRELRDRGEPDSEAQGAIVGELATENGEIWRVQFRAGDTDRVSHLFARQVIVTGEAHYFTAQAPRLVAAEIVEDAARDYVAAFDELEGCMPELAKDDLDSLMDETRRG